MLNIRLLGLAVALFVSTVNGADPVPERTRLDAVTISADRAWEDMQAGVMHFEGRFSMRGDNWRVASHTAVVHGPPERPDRVLLKGSPARLTVVREAPDTGDIEATAPDIDYRRADGTLTLKGGATLRLADEEIRSDVIEYDIDADRYRAGGKGGVWIEVRQER